MVPQSDASATCCVCPDPHSSHHLWVTSVLTTQSPRKASLPHLREENEVEKK